MDSFNSSGSGGKLEHIEERIHQLLQESRDYYFNEYLGKLLNKVQHQKYQTDLIQSELDQSYQLYLQRNPVRQAGPVSSQIKEGARAGMESGPAVSQVQPEEYCVLSSNQEEQVLPQYQEERILPVNQEEQVLPLHEKSTVLSQNPGNGSSYQAPYQAPPAGWQVQGGYTYPNSYAPPKKNTEVTIGAVILSMIGVGFILTAFVMLGMNYMNGMVKGLSLYAISIVMFLVSELLIARKNAKIAVAVTSIGIGGIYLSTVINYLHLHNINAIAAVVLTTLITAGTLIYSKKKKSAYMQSAGIMICYLCLLIISQNIGNGKFLLLTVILLLINIMNVCLPREGSQMASGIAHLVSHGIFAVIFMIKTSKYGIDNWYMMAYVISAVVTLNMIFTKLLAEGKKERSDGRKTDLIPVLVLGGLFQILMTCLLYASVNTNGTGPIWVKYIGLFLFSAVSIAFFFLQGKHQEKWMLYYVVQLSAIVILSSNNKERAVCLLSLLILSKVLSKIPKVRYSDAVLTTIVCLEALSAGKGTYLLILLAGILLSLAAIRYWTTYYEILITSTLYILAFIHLPGILRLSVMTGILFGGILLFHNVKIWQGKGIRIFNYMALAGQGLCFLAMADIIYSRAYITYLMMLVFGMGTIVLTFQERYKMDFRYKHLIFSIFLTYMAVVCRLGMPFVSSILLMMIAMISVGTGFALSEKSVRIYGLVLSLLVCAKVTIFDFRGAGTVQKMILFFSVGLIALVISGIYIVLEKREALNS